MIRIVTATRGDAESFKQSLLYRSLGEKFLYDLREKPSSLAEAYNEAISRADDDDRLVFVHDDVWVPESDETAHRNPFPTWLELALTRYNIVGLAGTTKREPGQLRWFSANGREWDYAHLSGAVDHSDCRAAYGQAPQACRLLDGLFLAARAGILKVTGIRFDPQFAFHFYDLDFCRQAERAGLSLGTWPAIPTHASGGGFGGPAWRRCADLYLRKWGE